jgi:allatostatin receptor
LQSPGGIVSKDSLRNKKRVVKLVTIVTVMFSLSWLPIQLILLLKSLQLYPVTILNISVQVLQHTIEVHF